MLIPVQMHDCSCVHGAVNVKEQVWKHKCGL